MGVGCGGLTLAAAWKLFTVLPRLLPSSGSLEGPKSTAATPPMTTSSGRPRPKRPIVATLRVPAPDRPATMPADSCAGLAPRNAGAGALTPDMAADLGAADPAGDLARVLTACVGRTTREAVVAAILDSGSTTLRGTTGEPARSALGVEAVTSRWLAKTTTERRLVLPRSRAACCVASSLSIDPGMNECSATRRGAQFFVNQSHFVAFCQPLSPPC